MRIEYSDFEKVDIRVAQILSVEKFPEGKFSSHILLLDFGEQLGTKKSLARLTPLYDGKEQELVGTQVIAVVNFAPRQIGKHMSEVLTLGVPDADGNVILMRPEMPAPLGSKLF